MKISKESVVEVLKKINSPGSDKDLISSESVTNIQIFGNQIDIDIKISNPTLQARKNLELEVVKAIHSKILIELKVKINFSVDSSKIKASQVIKGKPIPGIDSIIAIASGKGGVGKSTVTANIAVTLSKMGFKVGICTNKPFDLAEDLMIRMGQRALFDSLIGADSLPVRKPDPAPFFEAVRQAGGRPEKAFMIGDTLTDHSTAKAANVPSILVDFHPSSMEIKKLPLDRALHSQTKLQ